MPNYYDEDRLCEIVSNEKISTYEKMKKYYGIFDYREYNFSNDEKKIMDAAYKEYKTKEEQDDYIDYENNSDDKKLSNVKYDFGRALKFMSEGRELNDKNVVNALKIYKQGLDEYKSIPLRKRFFSYFNPFKNDIRDKRNDLDKTYNLLRKKGLSKSHIEEYLEDKDINSSFYEKSSASSEYFECVEYLKNADVLADGNVDALIVDDKGKKLRGLGEKITYSEEEKACFKLIEKFNSVSNEALDVVDVESQKKFNKALNNLNKKEEEFNQNKDTIENAIVDEKDIDLAMLEPDENVNEEDLADDEELLNQIG